jgi:hypothetical protein
VITVRCVHVDTERQFDPQFQKIERRFQRVGWALIAVFLVLTVLGLFGSGLLSEAQVSTARPGSEVTLDYARFGRLQNRTDLTLVVEAPGQSAEELQVVLSGEFTSKASLVGIAPEPDSTSLGMGSAIYRWQVEDWSAPIEITFEYEPEDWRSISGDVRVTAGEDDLGHLGFHLWVFP